MTGGLTSFTAFAMRQERKCLSSGRYFIFESYYLRQNDTVSAPKCVNAVGAALQFYFP